MYSAENFIWSKTEFNAIKRIEANIVKRLLNIPTRCHTTDLFDSLNIEQTKDYIEECRNNWYLRIINNNLTKLILEESFKLNVGLGSKSNFESAGSLSQSININELTVEEIIETIKSELEVRTLLKRNKQKV
jgi:hypothetical protein